MQQWCGDQVSQVSVLAVLPVPWGQHGSWMGTAASKTVPEWRGKLEGESNAPSWVESWLKTTGNENRGNIWVQLLHHFRQQLLPLDSGGDSTPPSSMARPHRWNRGCPGTSATSHPLPLARGSPGAGGAGEDRLRCPRPAPPAAFDAGEWQLHCGLFVPPSVLQVCTKPAMETRASRCPRKPAGAIRKCK